MRTTLLLLVILLFTFSVTSQVNAQTDTSKADSPFWKSDYGWFSFGAQKTTSSNESLLDFGFYFTPMLFDVKYSPYFLELKQLFVPVSGNAANQIYSVGLGYTQSNYLGRTAFSFGISSFNAFSGVSGPAVYASAAAYAEPYLPFGIGLQSSLFIHSEKIIAMFGISYIFDGAK